MNPILQYLKKHGERSDKEIAEALDIPLADLHTQLAEHKDRNQVMLYHSTKYVKGKEVKAIVCRIAGFIPPAAPGRKSTRVNLKLS